MLSPRQLAPLKASSFVCAKRHLAQLMFDWSDVAPTVMSTRIEGSEEKAPTSDGYTVDY
ncbi:MAG: hypothetical protein AAGH38_02620 [Pseudomonadota bacterium]